MSNSSTRVPRPDNPFDTYIKRTTDTLLTAGPPTTWSRLGLIQVEMDEWQGYRDDWAANWTLYKNPLTRTQGITTAKNSIKHQFIDFTTPLLNRILGSPNLTDDDRIAFNLPPADRSRSKRGKIIGTPFTTIRSIAVGTLRVRTRVEATDKRSALHPLADGVEIRYAILADNEKEPAIPPRTAEDCPYVVVSTRSLFNLSPGPRESTKRIYAFVRWVNLTNPANNSPWTDMIQAVIS